MVSIFRTQEGVLRWQLSDHANTHIHTYNNTYTHNNCNYENLCSIVINKLLLLYFTMSTVSDPKSHIINKFLNRLDTFRNYIYN